MGMKTNQQVPLYFWFLLQEALWEVPVRVFFFRSPSL
jgi:hypothetical protein